MSAQYGGFLFVFDEAKRTMALEERAALGSFTDVVSGPDWQPKDVELCLLSFYDKQINYAALVRRGARVAYKRFRFTFDNLVPLDELSFDEIEYHLGSRLVSHFVRSSSGAGSRVPPATWQKLMEIVMWLRPGVSQRLHDLEELRRGVRNALQREGYEIMAQEKDAVGDLLFTTGLRVGEVSALNVQDFLVREAVFRVKGKGGRDRLAVVVDEETLRVQRKYLEARARIETRNPALFLNSSGMRLTTQAIANVIKQLRAEAGIEPHVTSHLLRHTVATLLLRNGVDISIVQ